MPRTNEFRPSCTLVLLGLAILLSMCSSAAVVAQKTPAAKPTLRFVVILTRHGVRSVIRGVEDLNEYASAPWPDWRVPPGDLTPNGRKLMVLFGSYYRDYLSVNGLLSPTGCGDATTIHIRADIDPRTQETGRALAAGMMPGCGAAVHVLTTNDVHVLSTNKDPLFSPLAVGIGEPDRALAVASIAGRIGGNPDALVAPYRSAFDTLREVLFGCKPNTRCPAEERPGKQAILQQPSSIEAGKDGYAADFQGPLKIGSSLSEALLLEYANGMEGKDLGWGRLTPGKLLEIMRIHAAYADLARQTPYVARIRASNLLSHIARSMEQAVSNTRLTGSLGNAGDRVLIIVGHDTNISNIAAMLGISWLLNGYQPDETPPGGALIFELWQQINGEFVVSTYFTAQSLEQMHRLLPLSLDSPPLKSPIFVPGCGRGDQKMTCAWKDFERTIDNAIDPAFVQP